MITAILNCYKRPHLIDEQIEAIKNQTVKPNEIIIWYNKPENEDHVNLDYTGCKVVYSNTNFKFHARFAFALLSKTKYVAIFDDDDIPMPGWFENCLKTIEDGYDGILGSIGVILQNDQSYYPNWKVGWNGIKNEKPQEVDLVGHAWFLNKDYLRYLWLEDPVTWENGEDMQLSFLSQKYGGIKTYVPPHSSKDNFFHGADFSKSNDYGSDNNASWKTKSHFPDRELTVKEQVKNGWSLMCHRNPNGISVQ